MQVETVVEREEMPDRGETLRNGFRMGEWIVRPIEGMIDGRLGSRHLQPKSMDVLLCLASSPNHIVERDQLIEQVWGHTAVTDEPLTRCIHEIRRELSDTRDKPTYIQTIPKRGYRLIMPVEPADDDPGQASIVYQSGLYSDPQPSPDEATTTDRLIVQLIKRRVVWVGVIYAAIAWVLTRVAVYAKSSVIHDLGAPEWLLPTFVAALLLGFPVAVFLAWAWEESQHGASNGARRSVYRLLMSRRGIDLVVITVLLAALAGMAMDLRPPSPPIASLQDLSRLAVLPFQVEGDDTAFDWLGKGVAEDLLNLLSRVENLEVAAWTSSFRRFPETADIREIGHELNVHYVLTGKLLRNRDRLRVNTQFHDAQTGFRLWSEVYDRRAEDLFIIQEEIVRQVLIAMKLETPIGLAGQLAVPPGAVIPRAVPPTTSVKAYDYYLQARNALQRPAGPAALDDAAEYFTQAIRYDAGFAIAFAGLCTTLVRQVELNRAARIAGLANDVCRQAVEMAPESAESHTAYGDLLRVTGRPAGAIDEYQWVIRRYPRAVDAHLGIGGAYARIADIDKAELAYRHAIEIKPDYTGAYREYSAFLFAQGRYREVIEIGRRLIQLDPGSISGYETLGDASLASGQFETAIAAYREVIRRAPTAQAFSSLGAGYYYRGRYQAAIRMILRASELTPLAHRVWGELGDAYTQLGDKQFDAERAYSRARDLAESEQQIVPNDPVTMINLAYYCAAINDRVCASKYSAKAVALAPTEPAIHYYAALVNLRLGREAAAIAAAERALELGYPHALFTVDPLLESVRNSPRLAGIFFGKRTLAHNNVANSRLSALFP